jgi:hypothetical protein
MRTVLVDLVLLVELDAVYPAVGVLVLGDTNLPASLNFIRRWVGYLLRS